jgi:hypothetical protein
MSPQSKAWTVFARLNTGVVGSNPTRGMDVCVRLFCVCVLCVGSGLAAGWSPSKESYRLCIGLRIWKSGRSSKGWRAIKRNKNVSTIHRKHIWVTDVETMSHAFLTLLRDGDEWLVTRSDRLIPWEKSSYIRDSIDHSDVNRALLTELSRLWYIRCNTMRYLGLTN